MTMTLNDPAASPGEPMELLRGMLEEQYAVDTARLTRMTVHSALRRRFDRDLSGSAVQTAVVRQRIAETAQALRRMSDDTYGVCGDCHQAIPLGRLRTTPQAAHCVPCERRNASAASALSRARGGEGTSPNASKESRDA